MQKVELAHNHQFVSPDKTHMLRSQRHMLHADKHIISKMREAGVKAAEIYDFFQRWSGGDENVPFLQMDCNNFIGRERKKYLETQDAQTLLEYLDDKQAEDPSFFYSVQLDKEDGRICNFFWTDGQAIADYACFGDVLSIDTTFQTNKCEMPFAPIIGTNHHKQTILFGAALLCDESADSFVWLFKNFLKAMSRKQPETIFTYQCAAMAKAINIVFPVSSHRLCLWHIYQNAIKHLSHVISNNPDFLSEFKRCVYEERSVAHFDYKWEKLIASYNLQENSWVQNLYTLRDKWATVYRRETFCADMTSTQRSEGMNNVFKKTFRRKLSISEILVEYDKCIAHLRRKELYEDHKSRNSNPVLCINNFPMLKTAAESYTRNMYSVFEEEFQGQFVLSCTLLIREGMISTYKVIEMGHSEDEARVTINSVDMDVSCSCKKYNCLGILCKHVLRVFNHNDIIVLPTRYILSRWTKYAKRGIFVGRRQSQSGNFVLSSTHLCRKMISVALKCGVSNEVLQYLDNAFDKLTLEVEDKLSQVNLEKNEVPQCFLVCTEEVAKERISIRAPRHKKGPLQKRSKSLLEKGNKKKSRKSTTKKGEDATQSSNVNIDGASQSTEPLDSNIVMPFEDISMMFVPPIPGEFTNLLLQADYETTTTSPASRRLDFDKGPSTSTSMK